MTEQQTQPMSEENLAEMRAVVVECDPSQLCETWSCNDVGKLLDEIDRLRQQQARLAAEELNRMALRIEAPTHAGCGQRYYAEMLRRRADELSARPAAEGEAKT